MPAACVAWMSLFIRDWPSSRLYSECTCRCAKSAVTAASSLSLRRCCDPYSTVARACGVRQGPIWAGSSVEQKPRLHEPGPRGGVLLAQPALLACAIEQDGQIKGRISSDQFPVLVLIKRRDIVIYLVDVLVRLAHGFRPSQSCS